MLRYKQLEHLTRVNGFLLLAPSNNRPVIIKRTLDKHLSRIIHVRSQLVSVVSLIN